LRKNRRGDHEGDWEKRRSVREDEDGKSRAPPPGEGLG
jgi:hypothetical protein